MDDSWWLVPWSELLPLRDGWLLTLLENPFFPYQPLLLLPSSPHSKGWKLVLPISLPPGLLMWGTELPALVVLRLDLSLLLDSIMEVWGIGMLILVVLCLGTSISWVYLSILLSTFPWVVVTDGRVQFKALFTEFGMVEHSILLSQLDSMGRRR
jgi:hypothetical protein